MLKTLITFLDPFRPRRRTSPEKFTFVPEGFDKKFRSCILELHSWIPKWRLVEQILILIFILVSRCATHIRIPHSGGYLKSVKSVLVFDTFRWMNCTTQVLFYESSMVYLYNRQGTRCELF